MVCGVMGTDLDLSNLLVGQPALSSGTNAVAVFVFVFLVYFRFGLLTGLAICFL
jgi:hypothetical protein